ncbi:MAG: winged helix-turn-helix domain-containing protein [Christensenellales bacterium]
MYQPRTDSRRGHLRAMIFFGDTRTVDTHIKRLRRKRTCDEMGTKWDIITVYGVGYKFEAETVMRASRLSFRRVLVLVYGTVVVFALLITGIYSVVSPQIPRQARLDDLDSQRGRSSPDTSKARFAVRLSSAYLVPAHRAEAPPSGKRPSGVGRRKRRRAHPAPSRSTAAASAGFPPS